MDFKERKQKLILDCYNSKDELKSDFIKRFFTFLQDIIISLMQENDEFFGQFLLKIEKNINTSITVPIATNVKLNGFNMFVNPGLLLMLEEKEIKALLKHEVYHIMNSHYERERKMRERFCKEAINTALDISINSYINNLPGFCIKLKDAELQYNVKLEEERSAEEYAEIIDKSIKKRIVKSHIKNKEDNNHKICLENAHDMWEQSELTDNDIESLTKKTALSIISKEAPQTINSILEKYKMQPEIEWQILLKSIITFAKTSYKKTITRRDRRQPDRFDIRGKLPKYESEIIVAVDISASMNDDEVKKILVEILAITRVTKNRITVIECDNEIRNIYTLRNENDIQKRSKNNGSTAFSPVFKYIAENNLRKSVLIYFTDGAGEEKLTIKPINLKTLWVIYGDETLSVKEPYGHVISMAKGKKEIIERNIGLKMVNEVIHDWAR